jgi:GNAT superfamily N-acetyltransferase
MAFGWDVIDGSLGNAQAEFEAAGYELNKVVALVATPGELTLHSRAHAHARVRPLDPDPSSSVDEHAWDAIFRLQMANREPGHSDADYARFLAQRTAERRARFMDGDGAWYVAELDGEVVASCGIVVTNGRARYQAVDTDPAFQRKGLASRLIYDAGCDAIERFGAQRLVIVAEEGYHALPLYESLGFVARERTPGVCWWPRSA